MIRSLHIENIAVIRRVDLLFGEGLTVLTGETGAGKSVLIDSIGFLTGAKVGRELIRSGEKQATVSAVFSNVGEAVEKIAQQNGFEAEEGEYLLQRTLTADGRSVVRINGRPVTLGMFREIGNALLTIHGQHDSLRLVRPSEQREALDHFAGNDRVLVEYRAVYQKLCAVREQTKRLLGEESERVRLTEILQYQIQDIDAKKLKLDEEQLLLAERDKLRSLERIVKQINLTCRILTDNEQGNVVSLLERAALALSQLSGIVNEAEGYGESINEMRYELIDLSERVRELIPEVDGSPTERLDRIEGRLAAISRLEKKYGATIEEVLAFRAQAAERLAELTNADEHLAALADEEKRLMCKAQALAADVTEGRRRAAEQISAKVVETLAFLDMPKVRFEISVMPEELGADGADRVEFMLAANAGEPLAAMSRIASGGELSRIMLALSDVLNAAGNATTAIYDEIDTGISGSTSRRVGIKLKHTSRQMQTLCVTHSAQIASLADTHLFISKSEIEGRTETSVQELNGEARIDEISRILGGIHITQAQRAAALDMIEEGKTL